MASTGSRDCNRNGHDGGEAKETVSAGIVVETGAEASRFKCCDEVFYAGSITRPGSYAEFHLVDERIVGRKPSTLGWAETAVLPLTAITT